VHQNSGTYTLSGAFQRVQVDIFRLEGRRRLPGRARLRALYELVIWPAVVGGSPLGGSAGVSGR
jgi:hypothetical protein